MTSHFSRRTLLACGAAATATLALPAVASAGAADPLSAAIVDVEARLGARIGVSVLEVATGRRWAHRQDERFPLASTFKAFACAAGVSPYGSSRSTLVSDDPSSDT